MDYLFNKEYIKHTYYGMLITLSNGEEDEVVRVPYPDRSDGQMFAIAENMLGGARVRVICEDGKSRLGRIPGKLKKRMWIREDDLLIVEPWDFQDEKCDIKYRYTRTQVNYLRKKNDLPDSLDVF